MKTIVQTQKLSAHRLTRLYITALSTIAILAILGQVLIQFSLARQSSDAYLVNIAGRQRMLSQKLSKAALAIFVSTDSTTLHEYIEELKTTTDLWSRSQVGLQRGDETIGLPGSNSQEVMRLFAGIDPNFQAILDASQHILSSVDTKQFKPSSTLDAPIAPFVQIILTQEPLFLTGMNNIVSQYQVEAEDRITQLRIIEICLLALTIVVLLLEGFFVFRPAIQGLHKSIIDMVKAEQRIAATAADLESKNTELEFAFAEAMNAHRKVMPHARVVTFGCYQVQGSQGNYYTVNSHEVNGSVLLECECLMYQRNLVCSHSLAAASLHSALIRHHQHGTARSAAISPFDSKNQLSG